MELPLDRVLEALDLAVMAVDAAGEPVLTNPAWQSMHHLPGTRTPISWAELCRHSRLMSPDDGHELTEPEYPIRQALAGHDCAQDVLAQFADGSRIRLRVSARPVRDADGTLLGAVAAVRDVTVEHAQQQLLTRSAAQLAAVAEATRAVLRDHDARAAVCRAACSVSGALFAALWEPDGHGDLVVTSASGPEALGMRQPVEGPGGVSTAFRTVRSMVITESRDDPHISQHVLAAITEACGHKVRAGLMVPVVAGRQCLAVLTVGLAAPGPEAGIHVPVLEILAGEAAVAIERQDLLLRLEVEAGTDSLTGAANRRAWEEELPRAVAAARRGGAPLSVILLDVDHFKIYNDTHGHQAGDALLCRMVPEWLARLRPYDLLSRYGGEEFAVLLPGCSESDALQVAEALRSLVPGSQSVSAGVAAWNGVESGQELVARADLALYRAKAAGRDQVSAGG